MIVFYGDAENVVRAAKLKKLGELFNDKEIHAINMLADGALAGKPPKKEVLILNAHGSTNTFRGHSARELFNLLVSKGLSSERWEKIYLVACKVGHQEQDNSLVNNFAREFANLVTQTPATSAIKVYAPRGTVWYTLADQAVGNQTTRVVTDVWVADPSPSAAGKRYPLQEGMLLMNPTT